MASTGVNILNYSQIKYLGKFPLFGIFGKSLRAILGEEFVCSHWERFPRFFLQNIHPWGGVEWVGVWGEVGLTVILRLISVLN